MLRASPHNSSQPHPYPRTEMSRDLKVSAASFPSPSTNPSLCLSELPPSVSGSCELLELSAKNLLSLMSLWPGAPSLPTVLGLFTAQILILTLS